MTSLLVLILLVAAWQGATAVFHVAAYVLPAPSGVARVLVDDWSVLWPQWIVTLKVIGLGLALAFVVAMVLGYLIGHSRVLRVILYPAIISSQTLPIIAIAPILVIWFGYNILPQVLVTALIAFFPLTINTVQGYESVRDDYRRLFRSLSATRRQEFVKLSIPTALPHIFAGLKISATLAVIGATVAEWVGSSNGLGYLILQDTSQFVTARVFASIALLSFSGIALFLLVALIEQAALPQRRIAAATARSVGRQPFQPDDGAVVRPS